MIVEFVQKKAFLFLRLSLGVCFLWFGLLKLFTASPSLLLIQNSLPIEIGSSQLLSLLISFFEILLGIAFLTDKLDRIAAAASAIYLLLVTLLVLFTQGFDPRVPVLSLAGESVLKNLVLISACLVLLSEKNVKAVVKENYKDVK